MKRKHRLCNLLIFMSRLGLFSIQIKVQRIDFNSKRAFNDFISEDL